MACDSPHPGYRALRRGRCSMVAQPYLVTTICRNRHPWFRAFPCAVAVAAVLHETKLWRDSRLLCWVLMPDHLHVLVELGASEPLSKLMQRVKAVTARAANLASTRQGPIWMTGFHDRALRRHEDARAVARYVIANPLRAGLADSIGDYPYWDAAWIVDSSITI
ncbi:MAG: REP-associated tyrosine transposase [Luteimonas sp.]